MIFKTPKLNTPQDLLDFIHNDMDSALHIKTEDEIRKLTPEELEKIDYIEVGERRKTGMKFPLDLSLGRPMEIHFKD